MAITVDTNAYLDTVCDLLRQGHGQVSVPVTGGSMTPFLHSGDMAFLAPPPKKLKKGDIILYTRENGDYVLHRICAVGKDGSLTLAGDAQQRLEHLPDASSVHGIMVQVRHRGRVLTKASPRWQFFRHVWIWLLPLRHRLMALHGKLHHKK